MIIGLDVGGTHTDAVLIGKNCILRQVKVPTDEKNLFESVWAALEEVTRDVPRENITRAVLSTTLTTNSIAEGKTVEAGMLISGGPGISPEFFRTCRHYYAVAGSIDHRGREIQPVNELEIKSIASVFRTEGIKYVGVVGKFSPRNPQHEMQIQKILGDDFEYISLGHRISGNLNFPRRIATAYLNASVYPIHKRFFEAVRESLMKKGLTIPIHILKADGGTMSLEASLSTPGQTILSGPAASVIGSVPFSSPDEETLVLDIGGTTTDMAILIEGAPLLDPAGIEIGGYKTLIRSLKTRSIALGGDSAVRIVNGKIMIGPDRQGPAMAYGGPVATLTDALFVLGKMTIGDADAARMGIRPLAEQLGLSLEEASATIFDQACQTVLESASEMISDINSKPVYTVHELLDGHKVKPREILVLGGPAPYFAFRLAALTDFKVHVVPQWHVANAIGAALARSTCEITLIADTEMGVAIAPEEGFHMTVPRDFNKRDAVDLACTLLRKKCLNEGALEEDLEMEVVEDTQFNMVRGFYSTGKNIRVRVQIKPGLIPKYRDVAEALFNYCPLPETI